MSKQDSGVLFSTSLINVGWHLETFLESSPDAIIRITEDQKIIFFNQAAERLFGCKNSEAINQYIEKFIPQRFKDQYKEYILLFGKIKVGKGSPKAVPKDMYVLKADGDELPVSVFVSLVEEGNYKIFTVILRDRTEQIKAEERFRLAIEASSNAMLLVDQNARIVHVNSEVELLFGYTKQELLRQEVEILIPTELHKKHRFFRLTFLRSPEKRLVKSGIEICGLHKNGTKIPIKVSLNPLVISQDLFILVSITDISSLKTIELETQKRIAAEEANNAKDRFLAVVSHELRPSLNAIRAWAFLLRTNRFDPAGYEESLSIVDRNIQHLTQLLDDLADISRIERGELRVQRTKIELQPIIETVIETLKPLAEIRGIEVKGFFSFNTAPVLGDALRLQQVLANLLSNAIKFTAFSGTVVISLEQKESHVYIIVNDSGEGIDPAHLPYIFEPFTKENSSLDTHEGLGIGLTIAKKIIEAHQGIITAESAGKGRGATFTVQLPALVKAKKSEINLVAKLGAASANENQLKGVKLLLVEDERDAQELIKFILEQLQVIVKTCFSPREARQILKDFTPDVIISDIRLPGEDGYSFLESLRKQGISVPAIAFTAFTGKDEMRQAWKVGFQHYITKPADPNEIINAIIKVVGKTDLVE